MGKVSNIQFSVVNRKFLFLLITAVVWEIALCFAKPTDASAAKAADSENVLRATLKNGLRVVIVRNPLAPVATTEINYLVGSDEAPEGFPGTAHALEHMMFRGSPGLSASQLADISAVMGGDNNADTQQMVTQYFFTVPSEDLDVALHIEAIRMKGILGTDSLWDKERGAIEQEVAQDLSNPQYLLFTKLLDAMFHGTPYAHDALGTRASFDSTTGGTLEEFHSKWYVPNNAVLVIAGDVDPQKSLDEVKELFGNIPSGNLPPKPVFNFTEVKSDTLRMPTDLPYGFAVIAYRFPGTESPDYAAAQVLSDVLSNQRGKLYSLVPEGKALFADFEYYPLPKSGIGFAIAGFPKGYDSNALLKDISDVVAQELKNGVSPDFVEASKRHEISDAEFSKNSISGLASDWSDAVAVEGRQSPDDDLDAMRKVSVEDVNRIARTYIDSTHALIAVLTPQSSGNPISSSGFGGAESFAPKETKEVELPSWAENAVGKLAIPHSTIEPVVDTLPNGMKLIIQPESISNTVTILGGIKSNPQLQQPDGKDGEAEILNRLFEYGSTTLDRVAFQKALDDIGADESAGSSFSLRVLGNNFRRGVQLLADNELHPGLPEKAFKVIQRETARTVAGQLESPDYLTSKAIRTAILPKGDPALRETTPLTVDSASIHDVKDYCARVFRPDMTTMVVIGNVNADTAREIIWNYFKEWTASGPKPGTDLSSVPLSRPSTTEVPDVSRVQDRVYLSETLGITRSNPDYYALQLGNHVLGGGFYATRFYHDLRENEGLVYYVGSSFNISKTRGSYQVSYACDPDKVSQARSIIVRDLKQMQDTLVTSKELSQAKALLLREIPLSESSENSVARGLLSRAMDGLPLDEPILAAQRYLKLSEEDVKSAFAKWIRPDDLAQVTEGPAPK
ncbi:MAG TPA: pitrilysin family protein [Candidatus Acidoferrales bacterium]|nr:pitrilysin family protein [Candidatus Acidoferrales bacterium]